MATDVVPDSSAVVVLLVSDVVSSGVELALALSMSIAWVLAIDLLLELDDAKFDNFD